MEQGAVGATFLFRTDGKRAREIEYHIGQTGIKTRVTSDYKLKNLWIDESEEEVQHCLNQVLSSIQTQVLQPYTALQIEPAFFSQYDRFYQLKQALKEAEGQLTMDFLGQAYTNQDYQVPKDVDTQSGEIVTCIGSILILKKNEEVIVYDLSKWIGYLIQIDTDRGSGKDEGNR